MFRKIIGSLAAVILFPFHVLCYLVLYSVLGIVCGLWYILKQGWECFTDFRCMITDPGYIPPIGIGGIYARNHSMEQASAAAAKNDWGKAVDAWKNAARLYSPEAMLHLGECYEKGLGIPAHLGIACEWYRLALLYHCSDATEGFARLREYALPPKEAKHVFEEAFNTGKKGESTKSRNS